MKIISKKLPTNHDFGATVPDCYKVARSIAASNPASRTLVVLKTPQRLADSVIVHKNGSYIIFVFAHDIGGINPKWYTHFVYEREALDVVDNVVAAISK